MTDPGQPQLVVYVDSQGREFNARLVGTVERDCRRMLAIGGRGFRVKWVRQAKSPMPATWHYPIGPS